jgi:hypothetical protein
MADADLDRSLHALEQDSLCRFVPRRARQSALVRPAAVAIEDHPHVERDPGGIERRQIEGGHPSRTAIDTIRRSRWNSTKRRVTHIASEPSS